MQCDNDLNILISKIKRLKKYSSDVVTEFVDMITKLHRSKNCGN